jgi:hypothetical protein
MGRREITVEEITQALAKGPGDEEVGLGRKTQGPVHQENQRLIQTLLVAVTPSQYQRTEL